ncbi:uncharacterized protein MELLADRAFT_112718 [Melampsora larici-populina 98AG31]|uniref:Uncharacterized protein n=1 Tax=Melampsora larici-populina (strain 98AG31 / pathotype 3-4-7) TaxID=747676 RepID=F4S7D2_MELLP|nr:uncharacterized protein MELLADRAFT_112718 [Melampsora larici-populina 98AG31]EGF99502.1 hypothetical protein MELLADRAFT_112718 [Melampsora larici-populina 98AG31]
MSNPSATAGEKTVPSVSTSSSTSRVPGSSSHPRTSVETKPSTNMSFNNEKLDATGCRPLKPPGELLNYHYWQFVMGTVIKGSSFGYVLRDNQPFPLPSSDEQARCKVSALILRYCYKVLLILILFVFNQFFFMSNPSATAGDKTTSTSSKSPGTTQQQTGQQQTGRSELKPPITMTYNNEKLEATGLLEVPLLVTSYAMFNLIHYRRLMNTIDVKFRH